MNTAKTIILSFVILLFPLFAIAQKNDAWKKIYVVSTGDTTRVVNTVNAGLKDPSSKFLFKKPNPVVDSIYGEMKSNYHSLEEATLDINSLLSDLERDQSLLNPKENSLSYRLSRNAIDNIKKEREAKYIADSILAYKKASVEQLSSEYIRFENRPTYYINGVEVGPEVVNQLMPGDIVERELKVEKVVSGNPNGEVWFLITNKAAQRIKIPVTTNSTETNSYPANTIYDENILLLNKKRAEQSEEEDQRKYIDAKTEEGKVNFPEPKIKQKEATGNKNKTVRRDTKDSNTAKNTVNGSTSVNKSGVAPVPVNKGKSDSVSSSGNNRTRVVSRTINNVEVKVNQ